MTITELHTACKPNDINTIYEIRSAALEKDVLFLGKFVNMPEYIRNALVVEFEPYKDEDVFIVYIKYTQCIFCSGVM